MHQEQHTRTADKKIDDLDAKFEKFLEFEYRPTKRKIDRLDVALMAPDSDNEFKRQGVLVTIVAGCTMLRQLVIIGLPLASAAFVITSLVIQHWK